MMRSTLNSTKMMMLDMTMIKMKRVILIKRCLIYLDEIFHYVIKSKVCNTFVGAL
jgi:hypothetical protein